MTAKMACFSIEKRILSIYMMVLNIVHEMDMHENVAASY